MSILFLFTILILLAQGCTYVTDKENYCKTDNDCVIGGCSGTLCGNREFIENQGFTTCEWKEEYICYKKTTCECINNKCQWKETNEFLNCMEEKGE